MQLHWIFYLNLLVVGCGLGLFFSFRKSRFRWKVAIFLLVAVTFVLTSNIALGALASAEDKAKVQWYIDDLKSQGFDVEVFDRFPAYRYGAPTRVYSYSNFTTIAKDLNCSSILFYTGKPISFTFFFSPEAWLVTQGQNGWYRFIANDDM